MKKLFLFLIFSIITFGQKQNGIVPGGGGDQTLCTYISGPLTINVGQTVTFTSVNDAQCSQCYDWDINNDSNSSDNSTIGNLQIVGSDMNKTVSIKGLSVGTGKICLTYFTESGCNSCCIDITVIDPPNCCAPKLDGWFECRGSGSGNTGGQLLINDNPNCPVDWSKISSIDIWLNGANFLGMYSGNSITLTGPFTGPLGFSVIDSLVECFYGNDFGAIVTFNYNNGCESVQVGGTWYDYNTPPSLQKKNEISIYPNPTNSTIEFKGVDLEKYQVSIFDINGNSIIKNSKTNRKIDLSKQPQGIYLYKIEENGKVIQEGKITKK
jgi:hypothetical protein